MSKLFDKAFGILGKNRKCIYFLLLFIISCSLTEDAECKKQRAGESKCLNAFILFCSGNRARTECNGSLESTLFIGGLCQYDSPCKSSTDDVVKENVNSKNK
jgi:hypothetical protein